MTLRITESGPLLSPDDLTAAEQRLNVHLPDDYRAFLLAHYGGKPTPAWFRYGPEPSDVAEITRFFLLDEVETETHSLQQESCFDGFVVIGTSSDTDRLLLSTASEQRGAVFWDACGDDTEPNDFLRVTDSVNQFLANLGYPEPTKPWMMLIDDDDVEGLRQWIDNTGDVQARDDVVMGITLLEHAASTGRLEIVKLLVNRGAKPRPGLLRPSAHRYAVQAGHREVAEFLAEHGMSKGYWLQYLVGAASVLTAIGLCFVPRPREFLVNKLVLLLIVAAIILSVTTSLVSDRSRKIRAWWDGKKQRPG